MSIRHVDLLAFMILQCIIESNEFTAQFVDLGPFSISVLELS